MCDTIKNIQLKQNRGKKNEDQNRIYRALDYSCRDLSVQQKNNGNAKYAEERIQQVSQQIIG